MTGSTITGNTSKSIERHIGSSYKVVLAVSKKLDDIVRIGGVLEDNTFQDVAANLDSIIVVRNDIENVNIVAGTINDVVVVSSNIDDVVTVSTNVDDVVRVSQSIDEVIRVSQSADNVDRIALSIDNLDRVFAFIDNIDTVVNHADDIDTVANNIAQVIATGDSIADVNTVAANIAAVLNVSVNMVDVINASSFVDAIHTSVDAAAAHEANALDAANDAAASATASLASADASTSLKADVTTIRDEVETDRAEVELNTAQVSIDAAQVSTDKGIVEGYKDESLAAKLLAQQWATGLSGSGVDVPSDTNNAYYFSEVARNNANQTFKSGGYFTPTVGQEYPDVTGVEVDTIWLIKFANETGSYTFTTGDLAGQTVKNGFMLVYDTPVDSFDFIPTTLSGVASVNGVVPDVVGNIMLVASNISDVFSQTEVLAITNALAFRVTALENTATDHETRISTNETDIATKQDAATAATRVEGNAIEVPSVATADRITTGSTALFSFNPTTGEAELYNPITGETGAVGGGGVSPIEQVSADFNVANKKIYGIDLETNSLSFINATVPEGFGLNDWFGIADAYSLFESKLDKHCIVNLDNILTDVFSFDSTKADPQFMCWVRNSVFIFQVVRIVEGVRHWNVTQSSYGSNAAYVQEQIDVSRQYLHVVDEKATGVEGGSSVSGVQKRVLNKVILNTIEGAGLNTSTSVITLPAGVFELKASSPVFRVNRARSYMVDNSTGATLLLGCATFSGSNGSFCEAETTVQGILELAEATEIRLDTYTQTVHANRGLGLAASDGAPERYSEVLVKRIK